jgi:O-antigen/teichoic acid export membrane protein
MSSVRDLFSQSSSYFVGRVLLMLAGLISMPILTRILTKEDYGLMSLVFSALTMISTVMACGFPQATTRLIAEYEAKGREAVRKFCRSMVLGSIGAGAVGVALTLAAALALERTEQLKEVAQYLRWVSILIVIRVVTGVVLQIYRAAPSPLGYNVVMLANRYLQVLCGVGLVLYVFHSVTGIFVGTICTESLVLLASIIVLHRQGKLGGGEDLGGMGELGEIGDALRFGLPLVVADLLTTMVATGDRFVIQFLMGPEAVASYTIAYDISEYIGTLFATPIQLALLPMIFRRWSVGGYEETSAFVSTSLRYALAAVVPIIAGFALVGPEVIRLVASEKYRDSGVLVPYLIGAVMLCSVHFMFFIGLMIQKKTGVLAWLNLGALLLNQGLNWIMIPHWGILGAALAAVSTYSLLIVLTHLISSRYLTVRIDWGGLAKACGAASAMVGIVLSLGQVSESLWVSIGAKTFVGASIYSGLLLLIDPTIRTALLEGLRTSALASKLQKAN